MSFCRRRRPKIKPDAARDSEQEARLVDAEKRANVVFETTQWIHTAVTRRDQDNHWQDSVNRLFLGGTP